MLVVHSGSFGIVSFSWETKTIWQCSPTTASLRGLLATRSPCISSRERERRNELLLMGTKLWERTELGMKWNEERHGEEMRG